MRRGSAERISIEMKRNEFEDELKKQKDQMIHIESVYQRKLEEAQDTCIQVKATLQQNISSSAVTVQELKDQLNQLNDDLKKVQSELQSCQGNVDTLNNKLNYEMTQCHSQILSEKELCEQRVAVAKQEAQKNMEKIVHSPDAQQQENSNTVEKKAAEPTKTLSVSHAPVLPDQKADNVAEILTNDIKDVNISKDLGPTKSQPVSPTAAKQDVLQPEEGAVETEESQAEGGKPEDNNLTEDKEVEVIDDQAEEDADEEEDDPGMEGMLIQGKADETEVDPKVDEPEEYDADEPVVGGVDLEKEPQQTKDAEKTGKEIEEELADYNGDEENEGEFEADKQAELSEI